MAAERDLPDLDALALERIQLPRRLNDLVSRHERLQEMVAKFPNEVTVRQERRLAEEIAEIRNRIDKIDARLLPLRLRWPD